MPRGGGGERGDVEVSTDWHITDPECILARFFTCFVLYLPDFCIWPSATSGNVPIYFFCTTCDYRKINHFYHGQNKVQCSG